MTRYHPPLAESAEAIFENDPSEPEWDRQPPSEYTLARMEALGINSTIGDHLRENRSSKMSLAEAGDLIAASAGFQLGSDGLCCL